MTVSHVTRRGFLRLTGVTGSGLLLGAQVPWAPAAQADGAAFSPNALLNISAAGIVIYAAQPEMGQGIRTALPMLVAEELDAPWSAIEVRDAPVDASRFGLQAAGGSTSIPRAWEPLRRIGATARAMLMQAAAGRWRVPVSDCRTAAGQVIHPATGQTIAYTALATAASRLPVPDPASIVLKPTSQFGLLGTRVPAVGRAQLVDGTPLFSIDVRLPDMRYAVFVKCPRIGGTVAAANLDEIRALDGVLDAFVVEGNGNPAELKSGVAIVARDTWSALSARARLDVRWDERQASSDDWAQTLEQALALAGREGAEALLTRGDVDAGFASAARTVGGVYRYAFASHAQLEPQNATGWWRDDGTVEIWAPTQTPQAAVRSISQLTGIPESAVTLHARRMGGAFGRRLMNDVACEVAAISRRVGGPVKLQWTREDDMRNDFVRAGGMMSIEAAVDRQGKPAAWRNHFITFTADGRKPVHGGDLRPKEDMASLIPAFRQTRSMLPWSSPCGFWRSPGPSVFAFPLQGALHEMSVAASRDHLEFLLELLGEPRRVTADDPKSMHTGRAATVLRAAAELAGWGRPPAGGRALGLAFCFSHAAYVAQVADVSVDEQRRITVHSITAAVDAGTVVNLAGAEAQCQGSILDGLSVMSAQRLTHEGGRVRETNLDSYPLRRIGAEPALRLHFVQSGYPPSGLGEPVLPPVAPAVCNAVFSACGHRIRTLPISEEGFVIRS